MHVTLNLLSPEKKHDLRSAFALVSAERMLLAVCTVATFCAMTLVGVRMLYLRSRDSLAGNAASESSEVKAVAERTRLINNYLKRVDEFETQAVPWSAMMLELTAAVPPGVRLTSIRVERPNIVRVSGSAALRADVLQLKANLEGSSSFKNVRAPLSNILSQRNVSFDFDMTYGPAPTVPAK